MKSMQWLVLGLLMFGQSALYAGEKEKAEAVKIVQDTMRVCETKGMLACEPNLLGIKRLFIYLNLMDELNQLDVKLEHYIQQTYPDQGGLNFAVLKESEKLSINVSLTAAQIVSGIVSAAKSENGYRLNMSDGSLIKLRFKNQQWQIIFPKSMNDQFQIFERFYVAGQLKRAIIMYRLIEADMLGLTKTRLESNLSEDLAPVLVKVLTLEKVASIKAWLGKDLDEVILFYARFKDTSDMKRYVTKTYDLPTAIKK